MRECRPGFAKAWSELYESCGFYEGGRCVGPSRQRRRPSPGLVLVRHYKGRLVEVTVLEEGFAYQGKVFRSLSAVAKHVTGAHWNGYHFFGLAKNGDRT